METKLPSFGLLIFQAQLTNAQPDFWHQCGSIVQPDRPGPA